MRDQTEQGSFQGTDRDRERGATHVQVLAKLWIVCLAGALLACGGAGDAATGSAAEGQDAQGGQVERAARTAAYDPEESLGNVSMNPEIKDLVAGLLVNCTVDEKRTLVTKCANDELGATEKWFRENKPVDAAETLTELALTAEPATAAAAAVTWSRWASSGDADWRRASATPAAAARSLRLLARNGPDAPRIAKAATHLATLGGRSQHLFEVLEGADERVRQTAYKNVMTYGRTDVLPEVQELAKSASSPKILSSLLGGPLNLHKTTDAERQLICPWGESYLQNESLDVAAAAGRILVRCKGPYIDVLLEEAQRRVAAGQYDMPFSRVLREPCFTSIQGIVDVAAHEAQCERLFTFLEVVANDESVDADERGSALYNIFYQRRDATTLALLRKYENHPVPEMQEQARKAIKTLVERYDLGG